MSCHPSKCSVLRILPQRKTLIQTRHSLHGEILQAADSSQHLPMKYTTLQQRRCNVVTLQRRCKGVPSTLCVCWVGVPSSTTFPGKEHQQHSWHWEQNTQFPVEELQRVHCPGKEGHVHRHCTPNKGVRFHSM